MPGQPRPQTTATIAGWARHHDRQRLLELFLVVYATLAATAVTAFALLVWQPALVWLALVLAVAACLATAAWSVRTWGQMRLGTPGFAAALDRHAETHDLVATALAVESEVAEGNLALQREVVAEAEAALPRLAPHARDLARFHWPSRALLAAGGLAASSAAAIALAPSETPRLDAAAPAAARAALDPSAGGEAASDHPDAERESETADGVASESMSNESRAALRREQAALEALATSPTLSPGARAALKDVAASLGAAADGAAGASAAGSAHARAAALGALEDELQALARELEQERLDPARADALSDDQLAEALADALEQGRIADARLLAETARTRAGLDGEPSELVEAAAEAEGSASQDGERGTAQQPGAAGTPREAGVGDEAAALGKTLAKALDPSLARAERTGAAHAQANRLLRDAAQALGERKGTTARTQLDRAGRALAQLEEAQGQSASADVTRALQTLRLARREQLEMVNGAPSTRVARASAEDALRRQRAGQDGREGQGRPTARAGQGRSGNQGRTGRQGSAGQDGRGQDGRGQDGQGQGGQGQGQGGQGQGQGGQGQGQGGQGQGQGGQGAAGSGPGQGQGAAGAQLAAGGGAARGGASLGGGFLGASAPGGDPGAGAATRGPGSAPLHLGSRAADGPQMASAAWIESRWQASSGGVLTVIEGAAHGERAATPWRELHANYEAVAEASSHRESIPLTRRDYIRDYFEAIRTPGERE